MASINIGSLKFNWKGTYNGSTPYAVDDVTEYNGSSYICILASTGNLPTNTTYFQPMATKGTDGTDVGTTLTTQGDILYRDGSGLQRLAAGTANQVLQTGGAGANPSWGTVSSDFVKIASGSHSGAELIFDNFDWSTYKTFKIYLDGIYYGGAGHYLGIRYRYNNSGTQTTYSGSSYRYAITGLHTGTSNGNTGESSGSGNQSLLRASWAISDNAVDTQDMMVTIMDWNHTTHFKNSYIEIYGNYANGGNDYTQYLDGICQLRDSGTAYNGILFTMSNGATWYAKNYTLYGIK